MGATVGASVAESKLAPDAVRWDELDRVGAWYNRLLIYNARRSHRSSRLAGLGDAARPESGRLVMLLFFSTRPAYGLVCDPSVAPCEEEDDEPR